MILAAMLRLLLAALSLGSNDAWIWKTIANGLSQNGIFATYRTSDLMNHPPLVVLWVMLANSVASSPHVFTIFMKLPAIAGDVFAVALAARWVLEMTGSRSQARLVAIGLALNPVSLLISGYHCNTDCLYAFLTLLAAYYFGAPRRAFFLGGLALGAAINVKLIPVILIPAAFSLCRTQRDFRRLFAALAICVIPFIPLLVAVPDAVRHNMLAYNSRLERWGVQMMFIEVVQDGRFSDVANHLIDQYLVIGRRIIVISVLAYCAIAFATQSKTTLVDQMTPVRRLFIPYALFLIFSPGFGVQYTAIIVPLLFVISIRFAWTYCAVAGIFLTLVYAMTLTKLGLPLLSLFKQGPIPMPGALFGFIAWWLLLVFTGQMLWQCCHQFLAVTAQPADERANAR